MNQAATPTTISARMRLSDVITPSYRQLACQWSGRHRLFRNRILAVARHQFGKRELRIVAEAAPPALRRGAGKQGVLRIDGFERKQIESRYPGRRHMRGVRSQIR